MSKYKTFNKTKIGKILGIPLKFTNPTELEEILKQYGKEEDFNQIINFLNLTKRNNINSFIFKLEKIVINYIKSQKYYQMADFNKYREELFQLKAKLQYKKKENYIKRFNNEPYDELGNHLMVDLKSANFTSLKILSDGAIDINKDWSQFLREIVPNDERSNSIHNQNNGNSGMVYQIPDCLYESKFLRLTILSKLQNNLKIIWELETLKLFSKFLDLNLKNQFHFSSDEFFIKVSDSSEADQIIDYIKPFPTYFFCFFSQKKQ